MEHNKVTRAYNFNCEIRSTDDEKGVIEGRAIIFESVTDLGEFYEVIDRNALKNANLKDVRLCLNHDTSYVYARSRNNNENSTMKLILDDKGLGFRAKLDIENSPKARDFYSAIKRGDIDKMSFMFTIDLDEWSDLDKEKPTRRIKEIGVVFELSGVTFPAYESTEISARDKEALESAKATLESVRSQLLDSNTEALELEKAKVRNKFF